MAQLPDKGGSMSFPVAVIQTLSAFVIFVAGYLVLFVSIICALVLASCIYQGGRIICRRFALPNGVLGYTLTGEGKNVKITSLN